MAERAQDQVQRLAYESESLRVEVERLTKAAQLASEAIRYVREPHHLDHQKECVLCPVATDHLDLARRELSAALQTQDTEGAEDG